MGNILIICPWWQRPDVTELHCRSMEAFTKGHADYLAILSPEDRYIKQLESLLNKHTFIKAIYHKNFPLGEKLNYGISYAIDLGYEYIMNMGSDNLANKAYWEAVKPYIGLPHFRVNSLYIAKDVSLKHIIRCDNILMGVLRMVRVDQRLLYKDKLNRHLDNNSRKNLPKEIIIPSSKPYVVDIKSKTNITSYYSYSKLRKNTLVKDFDAASFI